MAITQLNDSKRSHTAYVQTANFRDQEEGMFPFTYWLAYAFDYSDIDASYVELLVPPGAIVLQVGFQVSELFTNVTSIRVGDGVSEGGVEVATNNDWIADAWLGGAAGFVTSLATTYALVGKRYNTGDTIDVVFGGTDAWTAGSGKVFILILSYTEVLTGT